MIWRHFSIGFVTAKSYLSVLIGYLTLECKIRQTDREGKWLLTPLVLPPYFPFEDKSGGLYLFEKKYHFYIRFYIVLL